jgi:N-acetylglucosaminyldiphosphoundecaprenol N-acetyl-beta-D-mannosaminyltransferase
VELRRSNVLGVRFVAEPLDAAKGAVRDLLGRPEREAAYLCPTGVHGVIEARKDPAFRCILNRAEFNLADGMPVVHASRLMGYHGIERAFGPDIMWAVLTDSVSLGASHFFYGGREGVAKELARSVADRLPGIRVAGWYCPPFRPLTESEEVDVASVINESGADVVWVGLSTPKQERWIARMRDRLDVKLICSVGAAFDYHTGLIKPAPTWMKAAALEWLFRLIQEPRRLWRRYFDIIPRFLFLITLQVAGIRRFPDGEQSSSQRRS